MRMLFETDNIQQNILGYFSHNTLMDLNELCYVHGSNGKFIKKSLNLQQ